MKMAFRLRRLSKLPYLLGLREAGSFQHAETSTRETADKTRKASAYVASWIFVSLLIGAFSASLAATFGGRQRDFQHPSTL